MADPNITTPRQFRNSGAKHTPAPWHTDGAYVWAKYQPHRDGIAKILLVDGLSEPGLYKEAQANAHLIVVAPEMYDLLASMKEHGMPDPERIEAVLKRARGE